MTKQELEKELHRLAPFNHDLELPFGLRTCPPDLTRRKGQKTRLDNFVRHAFPTLLDLCGGSFRGLRILDVACNCGGFSAAASEHGADQVLGVDITEHYIEQARFIKKTMRLDRVEFRKMSVEDLDPKTLGLFDVVFCLGLLYHLENPISMMQKIAAVTRRLLVVDTNVLRTRIDKRPLWRMNVTPPSTLSDRTASTSLWRDRAYCQFEPTASAVVELIQFLGFDEVVQIKPRARGLGRRYYNGDRATFVGIRNPQST